MAFKLLTFCALVAATNAGFIPASPSIAYAAAPTHAKVVTPYFSQETVDTEYDPHPQYSYAYDVQDSLTGDSKNQHETRTADGTVTGFYSLIEADGTRRIVDYHADPINGFNAVVRKEPVALAVKTVAAPLAYAAPTYTKVATPIHYAAPQQLAYAAPAAYAVNAGYHAPATHTASPVYYH